MESLSKWVVAQPRKKPKSLSSATSEALEEPSQPIDKVAGVKKKAREQQEEWWT